MVAVDGAGIVDGAEDTMEGDAVGVTVIAAAGDGVRPLPGMTYIIGACVTGSFAMSPSVPGAGVTPGAWP